MGEKEDQENEKKACADSRDRQGVVHEALHALLPYRGPQQGQGSQAETYDDQGKKKQGP